MVYLLTGENTFEIEQRLAEIVARFEGDVERIDGSDVTLERLPDLLAGVTLFSSKRLVIIKNASTNKAVWNTLSDWLDKEIDNDIVLVEYKPDKRTKTYKLLEKRATTVVAKELQSYEAVRWLVAEASAHDGVLDMKTAQFFVDYVGVNQWRLRSELEKIVLSAQPITEELIRELVEPTPQATSFELLDAAFAGRHAELGSMLSTVVRQEDPYMFFGLLSGQIYALALIHAADGKQSEAVIAKATGVHPFVLKKVGGLSRHMSAADIKRIVGQLATLDANMKSRPTEPWTQIQTMLLTLKS